MADTVREIDYYYVEVPDQPGEASRVLLALKQAKVDLFAFCGFPSGMGRSQLDFIPKNLETFQKAAGGLNLPVVGPKRAFLVQGTDRPGSAGETLGRLSGKGINVVASQALTAGARRWGMVLWVKPEEFERAKETLMAPAPKPARRARPARRKAAPRLRARPERTRRRR